MGTNDTEDAARAPPALRWLFAGCVLDESTLELARGTQVLPIERKPLEVLQFLLQHSGEVVTKEELLAAVWPGRILSDTAMAKTVSRLREVLGDQAQNLIKTVHGFGYRFAGSVRTEVCVITPPPLLAELKAGDRPPLRPLWTLQQRLGSGGGGDAWRVTHDKTGEVRVFKFARDPARLVALKREITLYRLIRNTLEDEAPIVTLLDWNLEVAPYFIESREASGGSLADWWTRAGGAGAVPLEQRIELVARIADALAAVHSIGVLHKDLKPSNVLLDVDGERQVIAVRLGDLGSGRLLGSSGIDALGITRLGFTRTLANVADSSGTPMYLAPEVLMGQPPTIQADIYALGVMLYQLAVGDLNRPLSAGWEREIADEILREDIAQSVDGSMNARLGDAAAFAARLRARGQRRELLKKAQEIERRNAQIERALERSQARRSALRLAVGVLISGVVVSTYLYVGARKARIQAEASAARATAISDFLAKDVFATIDVNERSVKDMTVADLLGQAAGKVDQRLGQAPEEAAAILSALAGGYESLSDVEAADTLYERAAQLYDRVGATGDVAQLTVAVNLVSVKYGRGSLPAEMPRFEALAKQGASRLGPTQPAVVDLRLAIGRGYALLTQWQAAETVLNALKDDLEKQRTAPAHDMAMIDSLLGYVGVKLGHYREAEAPLRRFLAYNLKTNGSDHFRTAMARVQVAEALIPMARYEEAGQLLEAAAGVSEQWLAQGSSGDTTIRQTQALLLLEQQRPADALQLLDGMIARYAKGESPDQLLMARAYRASALAGLKRWSDAEQEARKAVAIGLDGFGAAHLDTRVARLTLAEVLVGGGHFSEAGQALTQPQPVAFPELAPPHPLLAQLEKITGLIELGAGKSGGCDRLSHAREWTSELVGSSHWKSRALDQEERTSLCDQTHHQPTRSS